MAKRGLLEPWRDVGGTNPKPHSWRMRDGEYGDSIGRGRRGRCGERRWTGCGQAFGGSAERYIGDLERGGGAGGPARGRGAPAGRARRGGGGGGGAGGAARRARRV